MGRILIIEL